MKIQLFKIFCFPIKVQLTLSKFDQMLFTISVDIRCVSKFHFYSGNFVRERTYVP